MKKLILVLTLIVFVVSCAVINPIYTERRTRALQSYVSSVWYGWYGWYNPYQLYGYYNQYNPYYWGWNSHQTGIASITKTTITKRQLQVGKTSSVSNTTRRVIHRESSVSRGTTRTVVTKSSSSKKKK